MNKMIGLLSVTALSFAIAVSANAATIVNGSFETGPNPGSFTTLGAGNTSITGWTVGGASVDYIGSYWQPQDGLRSIDLAGSGNGSIFQTLATSVGQAYSVSFWLGRNPDGGTNPRTAFVDVGGATTLFTYNGAGTRPNMLWEQKTYQFVANAASTTLRFASDPATSGGFYGAALDNVSITAVPEPASWALMLAGFGLVGGVARRRKSVRVSFA